MLKFQIKTTTFDNLYIINKDAIKGNTHFRELDNNGNGEFSGEDIYIFGKEVYISTKDEDGSYNHIVKFKTIRNTNSAVDASFPKSYNAPKNILYSPLLDILEVGKTYTFKIKCERETEIAVLEGESFTYLKEEGGIFSGSVKINGGSDKIKIVYFRGLSHGTFYSYEVSE